MSRRSQDKDYSEPGIYHITLQVEEDMGHPLGCVVGDATAPDGSDAAPRVELTAVGHMVKQELLHSISRHYRMIEVQDYVVMPEHLHFIVEVHEPIVSKTGRKTHLGQVIAGFKKGCNRRYWEMTGQAAPAKTGSPHAPQSGKPTGTNPGGEKAGENPSKSPRSETNSASPIAGAIPSAAVTEGSCTAVFPPGSYKVPSEARSGRPTLFAEGYVDVMPLHKGQLATQRQYIRANPRSRLLRSTHRDRLQPQRGGIDTALKFTALMSYLQRECTPAQATPEALARLGSHLLTTPEGLIDGHSYGDRHLLERQLLPVICHRNKAGRFAEQKARCLKAAQEGAVLVSPRIAPGEQAIMDAAAAAGYPAILILDNGMTEPYHPSAERIERCLQGKLLLITPWQYHYRKAEEGITRIECKAMNCVAQALCRLKDDWWE